MRHLCITYHMSKPDKVVQTCITLPMEDYAAREILRFQDEIQSMKQNTMPVATLEKLLQSMARLQGYEKAEFCCAEEDISS